MLAVLTNKKPRWLGYIGLSIFLSCGQNVISVDPEPMKEPLKGNIELAEDLDTPLHRAILEQADLDYIKILLQSIDVNQPGNHAETALHLAVKQGNLELVKMLLAHQADVQAKNIQGGTPLHLAAFCGQPENIQILLDHQASIDAKDKQGWTPLHLAALAGQVAAVRILLDHQINIEATDYQGKKPYDLAASEAVKRLLNAYARRMPLVKLLFSCDYDRVGKRILDYLTAEDGRQLRAIRTLRETCTEMGWRLLQKERVVLQVTPDKLRDIQPYRYARLYPHVQNTHCVCPTFESIPVEVVVEEKKHVRDWITIAQDKRFLIKRALYKGNIYQWDDVRAAIPEHLRDSISLAEEAKRTYEEIQSARNPSHADDTEQIYSDNEQSYSDDERKSAPIDTREAVIDPAYLLTSSVELPSTLVAEATFDNPYLFSHSPDTQLLPKESRTSSENPYLFSNLPDPKPIPRENGDANQEEVTPDNPYLTTNLADDTHDQLNVEASASAGQEYSDHEGESQDNRKEATEPQEITVVDPGNRLYDSFVGVKKLPAGKVTIEKPHIAAGAFGKVFRGQWGNKVVALKQIDLKHAATKLGITSEEIEEAMQWEVARLSTVNHPNLVQFYGLYQDENEGSIYMVMEFCERGTLQKALEKADVPWSQRWQWALQISNALAYLHQEGVLHRDLKAENVLLDKSGRAKLADLGVAQVDALLQKEEASVVAVGLQDKRFIAPEVEADQTLSTKETDIYALGLVFWQIASGKEPRKIEDLNLYRRVDWHSGREREAIPADCPESFKALMLECWAKEPNQRPTAQGMLAKLAALGSELDPYHHLLVTAAQKLELIVHPKRKEGRAYIPPFVTQYSVDESIETYWSPGRSYQSKRRNHSIRSS